MPHNEWPCPALHPPATTLSGLWSQLPCHTCHLPVVLLELVHLGPFGTALFIDVHLVVVGADGDLCRGDGGRLRGPLHDYPLPGHTTQCTQATASSFVTQALLLCLGGGPLKSFRPCQVTLSSSGTDCPLLTAMTPGTSPHPIALASQLTPQGPCTCQPLPAPLLLWVSV